MPLKDFLEKFPYDPATFDYAAFIKKLAAEFDADLEGPTAKITTLTEQQTESAKIITQLKADKYDLLMATPGDKKVTETPGASPPENDPDTNVGIDDLFGERK